MIIKLDRIKKKFLSNRIKYKIIQLKFNLLSGLLTGIYLSSRLESKFVIRKKLSPFMKHKFQNGALPINGQGKFCSYFYCTTFWKSNGGDLMETKSLMCDSCMVKMWHQHVGVIVQWLNNINIKIVVGLGWVGVKNV